MDPLDIVEQPLDRIDIKVLAIDSNRFGPLGFDKSLPLLETLKEVFVDFEKFKYETRLPDDLKDRFKRGRDQFTDYLKRLARFDIRADQNFRSEHDRFESEIQSFYQDFFQNYGTWINFFRQDAERKSADRKQIEKERDLLAEARKQSGELLKELQFLKEEKDRLQKEKEQIQNKKGEIAATKLAIHFVKEAGSYRNVAKWWFGTVALGYGILLLLLFRFTSESIKYLEQWSAQFNIAIAQANVQLNYTPVIVSGATKFIILAVLWYGLSFLIRNYNVNSHLAAVNRHRTAVANTLEGFLASNPKATGEMLQNATEAMFKHVPVGYITKSEKDSSNPIFEIVNKIIGSRSGE